MEVVRPLKFVALEVNGEDDDEEVKRVLAAEEEILFRVCLVLAQAQFAAICLFWSKEGRT